MHEEHHRRLRASVIEGSGSTAPALREEIWRFVAARSGRPERATTLPGDALTAFVDTVAREAHRSTVDQVEALRAEGYEDDAIFEITVVTAASAGLTRLERALEALREEP